MIRSVVFFIFRLFLVLANLVKEVSEISVAAGGICNGNQFIVLPEEEGRAVGSFLSLSLTIKSCKVCGFIFLLRSTWGK